MKRKTLFLASLIFYKICNCQQINIIKTDSRKINSFFVGVNGNMGTVNMPWSNPKTVQYFLHTNAQSIRYPAGTIANTWDWDKGWIDNSVPDSLLIDWVASQGWKNFNVKYTLNNFKVAIDASGAEPVYVLNMLTKDLAHTLRGLRKAKELGLPVRHIEMGNELYFNLKLEMQKFPTPEDYGKTCFEWITAIKKEFPQAKCAIVSWEAVRSERHKNWTERVLQYATNADAVIFHVYTPFGIDGSRERENNQAGQEGTTIGSTLSKDTIQRQLQELELLSNPEAYNKFLKTAIDAANRSKKLRVPTNKEIWATEFNARADNSAIRGTWANTLFITQFYSTFLQNSQITLTHYHNIQGSAFAAIQTNTNGFNHIKHKQMKSIPGMLTAGGFAMNVFAQLIKDGGIATKLQFDNNPIIDASNSNSLPSLFGYSVKDNNTETFLIINYSGNSLQIDASLFPKYSFKTWHTALQQYLITENDIEISIGKVDENKITLPPYSITLLNK